MMKSVKWMLAALCLTGMMASTAFAGTADPVVNKRQVRQQKRIVQGVKTGELTRKEVRVLEKEQVRINRMERRMKSDGELTTQERARLQHRQNKASRHIYRAKHNNRKAQ